MMHSEMFKQYLRQTIEKMAAAIPSALDGGLRLPKA